MLSDQKYEPVVDIKIPETPLESTNLNQGKAMFMRKTAMAAEFQQERHSYGKEGIRYCALSLEGCMALEHAKSLEKGQSRINARCLQDGDCLPKALSPKGQPGATLLCGGFVVCPEARAEGTQTEHEQLQLAWLALVAFRCWDCVKSFLETLDPVLEVAKVDEGNERA